MSAITPTTGAALVDPALEPQSVRTGDAKAKQAYQTGLAFETMLVNQLAQQMTATVPGLDGTSSSAADDQSGGSSLGAYSSLLPQALSSSIISAGGTGLAMKIAQSLDPALAAPSAHSTSTTPGR